MEKRAAAYDVLDAVSELIVYQTLDGEIVWANRAASQSLSRPGGRLVGRRCHQVWGGREERCPGCPAHRTLRTHESARALVSLPGNVHRDVQIIPDHDRDGDLVGLLAIADEGDVGRHRCRDIDAVGLQRSIVQSGRIWLSVLDADGNVVLWNRGAADISGYDEEEVLGHARVWNWLCTDPGDRERVQRLTARILHPGQDSGECETFICTANGEERVMAWHARPLTGRTGPSGSVILGWDITRQKEQENRLRFLRFHDVLTGLYNRMFFEEELDRLDVGRQLPISIIMADVNGLKLVNDSLGYRRGDELLRQTADLLRENLRAEDIVARWGGDEFAILLPKTSREQAERICRRIRRESAQYVYEDGIPVSLSLGAAKKSRPDQSILRVVREAEERMYMYKLTEDSSVRSAILRALVRSLGAKSHETEEHLRRLKDMALAVGRQIDLPSMQLHRLALLASLHDIGKISLPEQLLVKEGELTGQEWQLIKEHAEIGYRMASSTEEFADVAEEILHHHERWDGRGYPGGLAGEEIPLLSRIIAVVDAYDAMRSCRPYSISRSSAEALAELRRCAGSQFDPEIVEVFAALIEGGEISWGGAEGAEDVAHS